MFRLMDLQISQRQMTIQEIAKQVQEKADARFDKTIERLLFVLRNKHIHQCWHKECTCEYCNFINGDYVNAKMQLHTLKKRIRYCEYLYNLTDAEENGMVKLEMDKLKQKARVTELKGYKKELQKNIL